MWLGTAGKRTIIVGLPGAFTPTCSERHLPGFVSKQHEFKALGFDSIMCLSVNDHFVSRKWGSQAGGGGMVSFLADGNGYEDPHPLCARNRLISVSHLMDVCDGVHPARRPHE